MDTHWSGHHDATCAVVDNYCQTIDALSSVASEPEASNFDGETVVTAYGLLNVSKICSVLFLLFKHEKNPRCFETVGPAVAK